MKNKMNIPRIILAAGIAAGLAFGVSSCKKDSSTTTPTASTTVTEADAAELTTDAVVPSTGGIITQLNTSASINTSVPLSCGESKDSTITKSSAAGVTPTYSYSLGWNYLLNCNGVIPSALTFNFTGNAAYDGASMSSSDKSTGEFVLSGLQPASSQYLFNATYNRAGTTTSKIARKYTFTSNITVKSGNIAVDKSSLQILSGSASVSITATSSSGKTFNFNGTITFLGDKKATLVLNSGVTYPISWE
jgi:hypothetical protein